VAIPTVSGTQYSSGRGDSVCVNTVTGMGGRHGVGRHFLPFLTRDAIGFDGLIDVGYKSQVETNYGTCFLGQGAGSPPAIGDAAPIVFSPTTNAEYDVQFPKIQRVPSRLRSRTK
jgi:CO dehydrogenase/acetyl-CoA synthase alpha subunit